MSKGKGRNMVPIDMEIDFQNVVNVNPPRTVMTMTHKKSVEKYDRSHKNSCFSPNPYISASGSVFEYDFGKKQDI